MLAVLYQPQPLGRVTLMTIAVVVGVTLYCLAYTALRGEAESPLEGVVWAGVHVVPFLLAFETLKRVTRPAGQLAVLLTAIAASLALDALAFGLTSPTFAIVQRLQGAGLALLLARTGPLIAARRNRSGTQAGNSNGALPLAPNEIDWVAAAGNYVELHAGARTVLHRAPLAVVESHLAAHGFVRIHRSRLVARRAVARLRPTDVVLHDGVSLKIGARYRAELVAAFG